MKQRIKAEDFEEGRYASIAENGAVQIGWGIQADDGWYVADMDDQRLAGPFLDRAVSEEAGKKALVHKAGASNPGW